MKKLIIFLFIASSVFSQWILQTSGTVENLNEVMFQNSNTGYVCGTSGVIVKTTNSGSNWNLLNSSTSNELKSISINPVNNDYVVAVGKFSTLLLSTNAGSNWVNIPVTPIDYQRVRHADIFNVYICGNFGRVLHSTNAGSNWNIRPITGADTLFALACLNSTTVLAAGNGADKIYRTTNSGVNWQTVSTGMPSDKKINDILFIGSTTGYALTSHRVLLKTVNGGLNWISYGQILASADIEAKRFFITGDIAYITLTRTDNNEAGIFANYQAGSGLLWYQQQANFITRGLISILFVNANTGFAACNLGNIFKTTNSGGDPIGIQQISNHLPEKFELLQNYPNPFNPVTNIQFSVPKGEFVKLIIYDALGKQIDLLVNSYLNPGIYNVDFNAANLNSGVYFYKISAGNFSQTKKMVLIK